MRNSTLLSRLSIVAAVGVVLAFGIRMSAHEASAPKPASASNEVLQRNIGDWVQQGRGIPDDWSHHYLVFSDPGTEEDAFRNGTHDKWLRIVNDPRYILQQLKRERVSAGETADPTGQDTSLLVSARPDPPGPHREVPATHRDWAVSLGNGTVAENMYPAKFTFNVNATPDCTGDFAVYGLNVAGTTGSDATASGIFTGESSTSASITFTVNGTGYKFTAGTSNSSTTYTRSSTVSAEASNLVAAIGDNSALTALVTAVANSPTSGEVTLTAKATGGTITITTSGTTDFGSTTSTSGVGQANLVALNELYSGTSSTSCTGYTAAQYYWAYNATTEGGTITTSPVLSLDGSKVIYVESGGTAGPYLHVLVWDSSDGGTPTGSTRPTNSESAVSNCPSGASCLVSIPLSSTTETVTNSSPFYDYINDVVYVGDDAGNLYKVTPVLGSGVPVVTKLNIVSSVGANTSVMTGPTYDASSGYVFVGASNGEFYAVTASSFSSVAGSFQLGDSSCSGGYNRRLTDAPFVDSTNGWAYEYVTSNNSNDNTVVEQMSTSGPLTTKNAVTVGQGDDGCDSSVFFPTHTIAFDNNYYTGTTGASGTIKSGHIWVCGRSSSSSAAELWEIPTSAEVSGSYTGSISGVSAAANSGSAQIDEVGHAQCSPFTEIYNGSTDYLFFGEGDGNSGDTNFGRLYGFTLNDSTGAATEISGSPVTYPTANGGTSAIVIDNVSSEAQASSIYFTTLATSTSVCGSTSAYCAVKLTQAGLQ